LKTEWALLGEIFHGNTIPTGCWGRTPDTPGERLNGIQEVVGSIPIISTSKKPVNAAVMRVCRLFQFLCPKAENLQKAEKIASIAHSIAQSKNRAKAI
jgi:hypothetical protein